MGENMTFLKSVYKSCKQNPDYLAVGRRCFPRPPGSSPTCSTCLQLLASSTARSPTRRSVVSARQERRHATRGGEFEYTVIDVASDIAKFGVFLIPQALRAFQL
jgi:hypothetical protein